MMRAPMVISQVVSAVAVWDAAAAERALGGVKAAAALGGRAALEQLLLLIRALDSVIVRELMTGAPEQGAEGDCTVGVVAAGPFPPARSAASALDKDADGLARLGTAGPELV